jgi:sulfate adenylyltransferase subunit 1
MYKTKICCHRSYAGRIASCIKRKLVIRLQFAVIKETEVIEISKFKSNLQEAKKGDSIQIRLKDSIDISRGMMFGKGI